MRASRFILALVLALVLALAASGCKSPGYGGTGGGKPAATAASHR